MDAIKYFRRRQFALGAKYLDFKGWKRVELGPNRLLTVHPDLQVVTLQGEGKAITLLGYLIDPEAPDKLEAEILRDLLNNVSSIDDMCVALGGMTGRFVLILRVGSKDWMVHDAVALRQVHYCTDRYGNTWCASQSETLAEALGFTPDEEVISYRNLPVFQSGKTEFWLPNDRTRFREIRTLLPNHYLDLETAQPTRYWPTPNCVRSLSLDESIKLCSPILENAIAAAAQRYSLHMGCSAGIDSRKTLAATRKCSKAIKYFSHSPAFDAPEANDVRVPARLLPKVGLKHHSLGWHAMSPEFRSFFEASATWAREKKGHVAHTIFSSFGPDTTVLNSNISEVAQCIYWLPKSHLNGEGFALLCGLAHPFAVREFQKWCEGANRACEQGNVSLLDLFFLEQRMARWATAAFSEYDIAHETFNPYNNRKLHCLMLGVPERYRRDRMWTVSLKHIRMRWPELLSEPINPQDRWKAKVQQFIRRFIVHKTIAPWLPLYPYLRFLKRQRRFRKAEARLRASRIPALATEKT